MTSCLGKSCSFGFTASAFRKLLSVYVFSYFPFGFEGRIWDLIVSVPDHCFILIDASFKAELTLMCFVNAFVVRMNTSGTLKCPTDLTSGNLLGEL